MIELAELLVTGDAYPEDVVLALEREVAASQDEVNGRQARDQVAVHLHGKTNGLRT